VSRFKLSSRVMTVVVALAGVGLSLSACSPAQAGAAATMGNNRITTSYLNKNVNDLRATLNGANPQGTTAAKTVSYVLQTLITNELIHVAGIDNGITVTPTTVAASRAALEAQHGGKAGLDKLAASQGLPPMQVDTILRSNAIISELGKKLAPTGAAAAQGTAVKDYLSKLSITLKTTVSPRYGTWDAANLQVAPATTGVSSTTGN
jgi:hypothetical protein